MAVQVEQIAMCRGCGGSKPPGQGRKLCDACRVVSRERERERARASQQRRYQENREQIDARNRAWAQANPEQHQAIAQRYSHSERSLERGLLTKYGLVLSDYYAMLEQQGGVCAICGGTDAKRRLSVDHCHVTGEVRGLLCSGCNGAKLGRLGHDPKRAEARAAYHEDRARRLRAAAEYLRNPPARGVL